MLIFGGMTFRNKTFTDGKKTYYAYEDCEKFSSVTGISADHIPDNYRQCAEELLNDIWIYYIKRNIWQYVKIDYKRDEVAEMQIPEARFGHSGTYVELAVKLLKIILFRIIR